jgi:hypothetical protein
VAGGAQGADPGAGRSAGVRAVDKAERAEMFLKVPQLPLLPPFLLPLKRRPDLLRLPEMTMLVAGQDRQRGVHVVANPSVEGRCDPQSTSLWDRGGTAWWRSIRAGLGSASRNSGRYAALVRFRWATHSAMDQRAGSDRRDQAVAGVAAASVWRRACAVPSSSMIA